MYRSSVSTRFAPAVLLAVLLLGGGCARLTGEGRLAETEAGPGPGQVARLLRMADDATGAGDPATAANLYGRALAVEPNNRDAARRLGEALLRLGRHQDAIDAFRRVLAADPGEPEASRGMAKALLAIGRPDAALVRLEEALARAPDDPRLLNARGVALDQLGRHAEAQAVYREGLARWPENASLRNNLGLSLALSGRFDEAIAELGPLARGPQDSPRARHNLAAAYALKGDLAAAEALLKLDLDDKDLRSTLAYYTALRGLGPAGSPRAARALLGAAAPAEPATPGAAARSASVEPGGPPVVPPREALARPALLAGGRPRLNAPEFEPALAAAAPSQTGVFPASGVPGATGGPVPARRPAAGSRPSPVPASGPPPVSAEPAAVTVAAVPAGSTSAPHGPAAPAGPELRSVAEPVPQVTAPVAVAESPSAVEPAQPPQPARDGSLDVAAAGREGGLVASVPAAPPSALRALPALPIEPARGGDWVVELGPVASGEEGRTRWQELRRTHADALAGVARLAGEGAGGGTLLAGPFADRAEAERACARLASATGCRVSRL